MTATLLWRHRAMVVVLLAFGQLCVTMQTTPQSDLEPCLRNVSGNLRTLVHPDGSTHPVLIPFLSWASQQITSNIAQILASEVMKYSVLMVPGISDSPQSVNLVAGCYDVFDASCGENDDKNPGIHFTLETWNDGILRVAQLPSNLRPVIANVLTYETYSGPYLWQGTVDKGRASAEHISLDYYSNYNAEHFKPFTYFDTWQRVLALLPQELIVRCSDMGPGTAFDRQESLYVSVTGDYDTSCYQNDSVWFSPACRRNTTECIPVVTQYDYINQMQLAFWLNMSVALIRAKHGSNYDEAYYGVIKKGNFVFGWHKPDDSLVDKWGHLPVPLTLPPNNQKEHAQHVYKTALGSLQPRNYAWRYLSTVDKHINYFISNLNFLQQDLDTMMIDSKALKDAGLDRAKAAGQVACGWVKANEFRWQAWIPSFCPPGSQSPTLAECVICPAGSSCAGGAELAVLCPLGSYCPRNSSQPIPCPSSRSTKIAGAASLDDCSECASGYIPLVGSCAATAMAVTVLAVGLAVAVGAAVLAGFLCGARKDGKDDDQELQAKVLDLGRRLGVPKGHGYVYAAGAEPGGRGSRRRMSVSVGFIPRAEMEAASRLDLFRQDVDLKLLDSLCNTLWASSHRDKLKEWLLDISSILLNPKTQETRQSEVWLGISDTLTASMKRRGSGGRIYPRASRAHWVRSASQEERFEYFRSKLSKLQVWNEGSLLETLKDITNGYMDHVAEWCTVRYEAILEDPFGVALVQFGNSTPFEGASFHLAHFDSSVTFHPSRPLIKAAMLQSSSELQDELEGLDDFRKTRSGEKEAGIRSCRQDLEEVGAVVVYETARKEAALQLDRRLMADEEVFLAQLSLRAKLLNEGFQLRVLEMLERHSKLRRCPLAPGDSSGWAFELPESAVADAKAGGGSNVLQEQLLGIRFHSSPPKTVERMREKLLKYTAPHPKAVWPLSANILDAVRCSIVCPTPQVMMCVLGWLRDGDGEANGLPIRRIKNKFSFPPDRVAHGYRDVQVSVIYTGAMQLRLVGEIQVHDASLYQLKQKMHKLYKIARAGSLGQL